MLLIICSIILAVVSTGNSINNPVYKIALTQKGYAQFLQYDVETPPLREFTFCVWIRVFDLDSDQSIFTYVANGNNRVVRVWLDTGGQYVKISIDETALSSVPVEFGRDSWRHVCLSYQSDYGAWALYVDSRLVTCEAAQSLVGRVLPGGGSVIVGYGIENDGIPNGLEGEIFGVTMILSSTIERNHTIKLHPQYKQKAFKRNKISRNNKLEYIILGDMKTEKLQTSKPGNYSPHLNTSKSYIKFKTPYSFFEHDVGQPFSSKNTKFGDDVSTEKEIFDMPSTDTIRASVNDKISFWQLINEAGNVGKFKKNLDKEISSSGTQVLPAISEYETPPPLKPLIKNSVSFNDNVNTFDLDQNTNKLYRISDIETPPPPTTSTKVYGQWTSSKFASSVLNYLKSINFNQREQKKVPATIPLLKISDSFPYASDIKVSKVRPYFKFQRKNFVDRRLNKQKRDAKYPEINVEILHDDIRDQIIVSHAQTQPKNVQVTNRGHSMKHREHRFHRTLESQQSTEEFSSNKEITAKAFKGAHNLKISRYAKDFKTNKLLTILPFLKTLEYYTENDEPNKIEQIATPNDVYLKSLSNGNKWHNVMSYSNDYTPRHINMKSPLEEKIAQVNKKLPSVRLKYKPESQKLESVEDPRIVQGRNLASEISNPSNHNIDSASLVKYNHGFLPGHDTRIMSTNKLDKFIKSTKLENMLNKNNFNKHVKLGNALNEQTVIGQNEKQNKKSFVGGDDTIPDINRYRSDIDREKGNVPPSLGPKICKNVELYDRLFYVQPDGSIDVTHILSTVREKNIGIEFIMQNYKKCSLENSELIRSSLLFIDWNRTPVRLFGGAYPKKTTDLCGFF